MKKIILLIFLMSVSLFVFSQIEETILAVPNANTAFGKTLPKYKLVFNKQTGETWKLTESCTITTKTLATWSDKELILTEGIYSGEWDILTDKQTSRKDTVAGSNFSVEDKLTVEGETELKGPVEITYSSSLEESDVNMNGTVSHARSLIFTNTVPTNINDTCNTVANLALKTNVADGQMTFVLSDSSNWQYVNGSYKEFISGIWTEVGDTAKYTGKISIPNIPELKKEQQLYFDPITGNVSYGNAVDVSVTNTITITDSSSSSLFNNCHAFYVLNDTIFVSVFETPAKLIRFNDPDDLSDWDSIAWTSGFNQPYAMAYNEVKDKLYLTLDNTSNKLIIAEVDPQTLSKTFLYNSAAIDGDGALNITCDDKYIYGVTNTPASFFKIRLSDGNLMGTNTWTNASYGHAIQYDTTSGDVYATCTLYNSVNNSYFARVDTATLTYEEVELGAGTSTDDFAIKNIEETTQNFVYVGMEYERDAYCIDTRDLSVTKFFNLWCYGLFNVGNDLVTGSKEGYITRFIDYDTTNLRYYKTDGYIPNEIIKLSDDRLLFTDWDLSAPYNSQLIAFTYDADVLSSVDANESFIEGIGSVVSGAFGGAAGKDNNVVGDMSFAFGESNLVEGDFGYAFGKNNIIENNYGGAFGNGMTSTGIGTCIWGVNGIELFKIYATGITASRDLSINATTSADLLTTTTTASLFNTTATTVNIAGAATAVEIGASTGNTSVNNVLNTDGGLKIPTDSEYGYVLKSDVDGNATWQASWITDEMLNVYGDVGTMVALSTGTGLPVTGTIDISDHPGVRLFKTSATLNSGYTYYGTNTGVFTGDEFMCSMYFADTAISLTYIGFHNVTTSRAEPTDGVYFRKINGVKLKTCVTVATSVTLGDTTFSPVPNTWYTFYIKYLGGGASHFIIHNDNTNTDVFDDYTLAVNPSNTVNQGASIVSWHYGTPGVATDLIGVDHISYRMNRVLNRYKGSSNQ